MTKEYLELQHSESVVVHAASRIYAAYIASGQVKEGESSQYMKRAISEAIAIAKATDKRVVSDEEIDMLDSPEL